MSSKAQKPRKMKPLPNTIRMASLSASGRMTYQKVRLPRRRMRRRKKATFLEMFGSLFYEDLGPDAPAAPPCPTASAPPKRKSYTEKRKTSQAAWAKQRQQILGTFVEARQMPSNQTCTVENCQEPAAFWCPDCGTGVYHCSVHVVREHQRRLHVPNLWKDGAFSPVYVDKEPWTPNIAHQCSSQKERPIVVVDAKGRHHRVPVLFCDCSSDVQQLIRLRLWPATPTRPQVAFHWDLMTLLRVMSLECHASLKSLCEALRWLSPSTLPTYVKNVYSLLSIDSFGEFKLLITQLDSLQFLEERAGENTMHPVCPACPKSGGRRIISLDAMFGLKRWRKSGSSDLPPRYAETFFIEQARVDAFLAAYSLVRLEKNCSSFQAGNAIHVNSTASAIDETGLFGAVCRHEMPLAFFSLKQGEQIGNAVFLIKHLLAELPSTKHYILYDIACTLHAHLKKSGQGDLLRVIELAVPAFHVYGHKPSCQVQFSPRRVPGFALSDGEQVERLWSFLRNFCQSTKEMTAANRIDSITDALIHYANKTTRKMGEMILQRYNRAVKSLETAKVELEDALSSQSKDANPLTEDDIKRWISATDPPTPAQISSIGLDLAPDEIYALQLSSYYTMCDELEKADGSRAIHAQIISRKVVRMDEQLRQTETEVRWSRDNPRYIDALRRTEDRKRLSDLNQIHTVVVERWFLLTLKKKYADGQKIAKRLCLQIKKASTKVKKAVSVYNEIHNFKLPSLQLPNTVLLEDAFDVKSSLWECLFPNATPTSVSVPQYAKRLLTDNYLRVQHCRDEVSMLKEEMVQIFSTYESRLSCLNTILDNESLSAGARGLVMAKKAYVEHDLYLTYTLFHCVVPLREMMMPSTVPSVSLQDQFTVYSDVDMVMENEEDDEDTYLDELLDAAGEISETE